VDTLTERQRTFDADQMAVASFILGLLGLLVFNLVLGPCAIVLAAIALIRRTRRPVRAGLGIALGLADLAVLAASVAASHGTIWHVG
jgi:threonine/homoserine/homoserine lactone efflux protein